MERLPGKEAFQNQLDTIFRLSTQPEQEMELKLVDIHTRPSDPRIEQFSLFFQGPMETFLPQQTYHLRQERLGEIHLFLVPVARNASAIVYEAVINTITAAS